MARLVLVVALVVLAALVGGGLYWRHRARWAPAVYRPPHRWPATLPPRRRLRVYLLLGQSNMVGTGIVAPADTVPSPRVLRLSPAGRWDQARDPLHAGLGTGVGPGLSFGRALAAHDTSLTIGLVPAAVNGSALADWQPGAARGPQHPYDDALALARRAQQDGRLAGVVWHQGESDNTWPQSATYGRRLQALIARLRTDLRAPTLPFVAGELPFRLRDLDAGGHPHPTPEAAINDTLAALVGRVPHYAGVSAAGATARGDLRPLDAASARRLGRRYAAAMLGLQQAARLPAPPPQLPRKR